MLEFIISASAIVCMTDSTPHVIHYSAALYRTVTSVTVRRRVDKNGVVHTVTTTTTTRQRVPSKRRK